MATVQLCRFCSVSLDLMSAARSGETSGPYGNASF
jgi:hypothetical protein